MAWFRRVLAGATALAAAFCLAGPALAADAEDNLLINGGFEQLDADGMPEGWYTDEYNHQEGYTVYSVTDDAHGGANAAVIENLGMNDARFAQDVTVEPETLYCLSGWIRADGILDSGRGANLSVEGLYVFSDSVFDTQGAWKYIEFYGETGEKQTSVTVFARLGGYSGESQGKAAFDDLSLRRVDGVPGDGVAALWFSTDTPVSQQISPVAQTEGDGGSPFWPWLLVLAAAYLLLCAWASGYLAADRHELDKPGKTPLFLILGLLAAAAARVFVALRVTGYPVDVNCFRSWGATMARCGASGFYPASGFCDYPPAYVYVLGLNSVLSDWLSGWLGAGFTDTLAILVIKLIPMACDLIASWILYRFAREEGLNGSQAGILSLLMAVNPAQFLNSAAWCQMDSVLCLGLMLVAYLAIRRKWTLALPVYVLCALVKPQALMLGFLGLTAIVLDWVRQPEDRKAMLRGLGLSAALAAAILIPFSIGQKWDWLITLYQNTLASYPYATVNTANLYYLFGGNWAAIDESAGWLLPGLMALACALWGACLYRRRREGVRAAWLEPALMAAFAAAFAVLAGLRASWGAVGATSMALAFALVLPMYVRGGKLKNLPLLGGILFLLLYVLGVKMHERYLFPALLFFGIAFAISRDRRVLLLLAVVSCTMFVNEGIVLDNALRLGAAMGHLNQDTYGLNMALAVLNVLCVPLAVWIGQRVCAENVQPAPEQKLKPLLPIRTLSRKPGGVLSFHTDASLRWRKLDWLLMLSVTLVYSVVALWNLGSTKAPQNPWKSTTAAENVVIDLGASRDDFRMLYFAQVSYSDFSVAVSDDGKTWSEEYWAQMAQGQCWRWKYVTLYNQTGDTRTFMDTPRLFSGRYVRLTSQQIGLILDEVIFRDSAGDTLPATILSSSGKNVDSPLASDPAALLDEQDTLDGEPSWYNSTYFDEIYHARTAYEHLHGTTPYETTHPPLGKVIMSLGIAIFGMTPFGWRFMGALMGILMLPAMYLLGKQLTKRSDMAFAAMAMMALDCMHLTQTRIATIDSFPVFFIIVAYFFMLRFMQRDLSLDPLGKLLPDLALSGLSMGCAIASKWIGIYAGAGLGVLYFWTCARHLRLAGEAENLTLHAPNALTQGQREALRIRSGNGIRRVFKLCLWCLLFFVAVPAAIYLLSYIPYFAYADVNGPLDFVNRVVKAQINMFDYQSTPGLGMDHPYYSPWWDWPLIKKPMWYAMAQFMPAGYSCSIFCFGNPAVWLTGLAGIGATAVVLIKRRRYLLPGSDRILHWTSVSWNVGPAFVLLGLLAQFLPWVLVPRGTYIYHYFASVPFLILGTTLLLNWLSLSWPKAGRIILIAYLGVCLVFFVGYYPYASGTTTPTWWLDFMKQFLRIYY